MLFPSDSHLSAPHIQFSVFVPTPLYRGYCQAGCRIGPWFPKKYQKFSGFGRLGRCATPPSLRWTRSNPSYPLFSFFRQVLSKKPSFSEKSSDWACPTSRTYAKNRETFTFFEKNFPEKVPAMSFPSIRVIATQGTIWAPVFQKKSKFFFLSPRFGSPRRQNHLSCILTSFRQVLSNNPTFLKNRIRQQMSLSGLLPGRESNWPLFFEKSGIFFWSGV